VGALRREVPDQLVGRYETIRADVASRESVGQRLFRQRGLAAWLSEWCCSPGRRAGPRTPTRVGTLPASPASTGGAEALTMAVACLVHTVITGATPC